MSIDCLLSNEAEQSLHGQDQGEQGAEVEMPRQSPPAGFWHLICAVCAESSTRRASMRAHLLVPVGAWKANGGINP